ncbi:MAG TPA: prephenate dehydrogenase/arogenate dehydrogenase family protein [Candidatus Saccharicenans sp.]|nr:prephenate dehydrogenase/arogenate dehydrogenase family protein [Candidatus Saccharicenans sp.]
MRIAVIGAGSMGSWLVHELAEFHQVGVYDRDSSKTMGIKNALPLGSFEDLAQFRPEFLFNAVSLRNTIEAFEAAAPFLDRDCFLVDIASIKGELPEYYQQCPFRFVSCHPMFGPRFALLNQIKNENLIIISESNEKAKKYLMSFFEKCQLNIFQYSFSEHDELMSYSLTLPFASSITFAACLTTKVVPGTTFAHHKDIARKVLEEDDFLLAEVLFNPHSIRQLEKICSKLEFLKHIIKARDYEEAEKFLARLRKNLEQQ